MSFLPRHERMREVAYEERRVLTVDGKAVLQIRACRGMLQPDGPPVSAFSGGDRRCLSGTEYDHEKTRGGLNRPRGRPGSSRLPGLLNV